jgi:transcriptional regulator with XRE-family HTH domain
MTTLREVLGLNQQALGEHLGVSYKTISRYEQGQLPNIASLWRLARLALDQGQEELAHFFLDLRHSQLQARSRRSPLRIPASELQLWADLLLEIAKGVEGQPALSLVKELHQQMLAHLP